MLLHSAAICEVALRHCARAPLSTAAPSWGWAALAFAPRPFLPIAPECGSGTVLQDWLAAVEGGSELHADVNVLCRNLCNSVPNRNGLRCRSQRN